MPEQVRDIKRRIRSIKSTQKITKAMEMVAAAKLRRAQDKAMAARPYAREIQDMMQQLLPVVSSDNHPMLVRHKGHRACYVTLSADRGLCGGFNSQVSRYTQILMSQQQESAVIAVGRKGRDYFRRRGYKMLAEFIAIGDDPSVVQTGEIAQTLLDLYEKNVIDEINLVYTEFISAGKQRPTVAKLLPLDVPTGEDKYELLRDYFFVPEDPAEVLDILLPRFIIGKLHSALLESNASLQAARMMAMGAASTNALEMMDQLTMSFNKARQAAITSELSEIVGGADALRG
jgi:F-type H+-transporting ATPase subunit gamma